MIDTRLPAAFAAGHRQGAINLQWDWDQLPDRTRAYVPDPSTPIAVRGTDAREAQRAVVALRELGYDDVALARDAPEDATLSILKAAELRERLAGSNPPVVIDVRTEREWRTGTIDGALLTEQDEAPLLLESLDKEREYAVICEGGFRSSQLASLMRRAGFVRVHNVIDGMYAWRKSR